MPSNSVLGGLGVLFGRLIPQKPPMAPGLFGQGVCYFGYDKTVHLQLNPSTTFFDTVQLRISWLTRQMCLSGLNRVSKTNVGFGPRSGFKMRPVYNSAVENPQWDLTPTYYWSSLSDLLAGSALGAMTAISYMPLPTPECRRRSNIVFITNILQVCCRQNGIVIFFFKWNFFSVKRPTKMSYARQLETKPDFWNSPEKRPAWQTCLSQSTFMGKLWFFCSCKSVRLLRVSN